MRRYGDHQGVTLIVQLGRHRRPDALRTLPPRQARQTASHFPPQLGTRVSLNAALRSARHHERMRLSSQNRGSHLDSACAYEPEFEFEFEFVNRPTGQFILRSRPAGSKGSDRFQAGAVAVEFDVAFEFVAASFSWAMLPLQLPLNL
jgi:hypothetical protein